MTCSPKKLIKNTSLTPEEVAQLGIFWEQISPGVFQLRGPDIRQRIKNVIARLRQHAESHIEEKPSTDGTFDCTAAAKAFLHRLQVIECFLAAAERNGASGDLYQAVYHSLLLAINDHQLTVVDNETAIAAREVSIKASRDDAERRSEEKRIRDREMAKEFKNSQGGRMSPTALMAKIGAKRKLKRSASINAVKSGLRELKRRE